MSFKNILSATLIITFIAIGGHAFAQQKLKDELIDQLKGTTTVFFYKNYNEQKLDSFKKTISSVWDITPIIFSDLDQFKKYTSDPKYSYFIITGYTQAAASSDIYSRSYFYLDLKLFNENPRRDDPLTGELCRIELFPDYRSIQAGLFNLTRKETPVEDLYEKAVYNNWSPVLLKAQLANVCSNLKAKINPARYGSIVAPDLSKLLSNDTLYIPLSSLVEFKILREGNSYKSPEVVKAYNFNYRICDDAELYDIFQTQGRGRFLFEYVRSFRDKFITVYDLKDKKIVYRNYAPATMKMDNWDFKKIK